ncbi:MAG: PAS domain S-box protein, partial [Calditrichaeota bacterium]|nr:PAS domain S-box protein [Calditrichota bacterium]
KTVIICDTTSWERQVLGQRKAEQALESWISDRTDELMEANFRLAEEGRRHRKTAEALKKSEQDFRLLYENAPLAYFTLDHLGIVRRLNKSARELMGNPTYPIKGRRFQSLFQNGTSAGDLKTLLEANKVDGLELHLKLREDLSVWVSASLRIFEQSEDDQTLRLLMLTDISPLKKAEAALKISQAGLEKRVVERTAKFLKANEDLRAQMAEHALSQRRLLHSEARFRQLFNGVRDAIFVIQPDSKSHIGRLVETNNLATQMLGYSRQTLLSMTTEEILAPDEHLRIVRQMERIADDNFGLFETALLTRTGKILPVEVNSQIFKLNGRTTILAAARDISARREAEQRIREQAALLDKARDAIMVLNLDENLVYWNRSASRLFGWQREEVLGKSFRSLLVGDELSAFWEAQQATFGEGAWSGELALLNRSGKEVVVESRWTLVRNDAGIPTNILVVNTDVSERKKLEMQFLRAQRMESIGTLASGIAHDLNNVLTPILMAVQLMGQSKLDPDVERRLKTIEKNTMRGAEMVKQVLSFVRGVEGERVTLQPRHLLRELERIIRETFPRSIEVSFFLPRDLWEISGDATQLHQVILNLCVNARDAMPDGGKLHIEAQNLVLDQDFVRTELDATTGPFVKIAIQDSGTGIAPVVLERIFEPFFTTKDVGKGTGLGLSTVQAIVRSHGGFVQVNSEIGHGSEFCVYLPADADIQLPVQRGEEEETSPWERSGKGETILVVDDEEAIREITSEILEEIGYSVLTAENGAEAVACFSRRQGKIDLVLLDMMMPIMDGNAAISALRNIRPDVKIVAASGFQELPTDEEKAKVAGFLQKPYSTDSLVQLLKDVLANPAPDKTVLP